MAGAVVQAQRTEGPAQRVATAVVGVLIQSSKPPALGQQAAVGNAVGQGAVTPLQKRNHPPDGGGIGLELSQKVLHLRTALFGRQGQRGSFHLRQALHAQQPQHQRQRQIGLHRIHPARPQKTRDVGGGRVGRVELRHRRDDGQHAAWVTHRAAHALCGRSA